LVLTMPPLSSKFVGDLHRADQQAAGIAAHVEDQATQRRILLQAIDRLVEIAGGGGLETADAHVAEAGLQHPRTDAGGADGGAHQGDVERFRRAFADDAHDHLGTGLAAQRRRSIAVARHQRLAVDGDDEVAAAQARAFRRAVVERRDDAHAAFRQLLQFQPDAVVGAAGEFVEFLRIRLLHVGAVRIEVQQQAAHRGLHQRLVVDRVHVGLADGVVDHDVAADLVQRHLGGIGLRRVGIVAGERVPLILLRGGRHRLRRRLGGRCGSWRRLRECRCNGHAQQGGDQDGKRLGPHVCSGCASRLGLRPVDPGRVPHHARECALRCRARVHCRVSQPAGLTGDPLRRSSKYSAGLSCPPEVPTLATCRRA
jgi:hypothetical protein